MIPIDYLSEFLDAVTESSAYEPALAKLSAKKAARVRADIAGLRRFHEAKPEFMTCFVSELQLLHDAGWSAGGANSLFHFLRWRHFWDQGEETFQVGQNRAATYCQLAVIFWPEIANGMMKMKSIPLDAILGVRIEPLDAKRKRYTRRLLCADGRPIEELWRPTLPLPQIPRQAVPPEVAIEPFVPGLRNGIAAVEELVSRCPGAQSKKLHALVQHVRRYPELLDFMTLTALDRGLFAFSLDSLWEYAYWMLRVRRPAEHQLPMPSALRVFYCRLIVMLHPVLNGRTEVKQDGFHGKVNRLFGIKVEARKQLGSYAKKLVLLNGSPLESLNLQVRHVPQKSRTKKHLHSKEAGATPKQSAASVIRYAKQRKAGKR